MQRAIVFVETNMTTGRLFVRKCHELGVCAVVLAKSPENFPYLRQDGVPTYQVDTRSLEQVRAVIDGLPYEIVGIWSSGDWGIYQTAVLSRERGLPSLPPEAVRICRDKVLQRRVLRDAGLDDVNAWCVTSADELGGVIADLPLPLVLKPASASGSIGAKRCETAHELLEHCKFLDAQSLDWVRERRYVLEEYIDGPQYSVEVFNGSAIAVVRQHYGPPPHFVASGHDFPGTEDDGIAAALAQYASAVARQLGLDWGPCHIEVRYDTARRVPRLVEANPRLVGAYVPELLRHAAGVDLVDLSIRNLLEPVGVPQVTPTVRAVMRFLVNDREGRFLRVDGADDAALEAGVRDVAVYPLAGAALKREGDFRARIGHVIATGSTIAAAEAAAQRALSRLEPVLG
jgi:S-sulfo-L-cysteine synthase (3-phospho-L-serine-dependent)